MVQKTGTYGYTFLEGTQFADTLIGDTEALTGAGGGDQIHGYDGADALYGDA